MKQQLDSRLKELEATVDALTDEIVELRRRIDELEGSDEAMNEEEIGVGMDSEEEEEDDIYVA